MIPVRIAGTGSVLPGRPRTTAELVAAAMPGRDPADMVRKTGIHTRHFVDPGTTAVDMAAEAVARALVAAGLRAADLRRLIFVSSTGGDDLVPANANAVLERLGVAGGADGFDINNGCMGFLTGFDLAARSAATGLAPVAVVVSETHSRYLTPSRPRPYMVLADGAGAVVLDRGRAGEGLLAVKTGNHGALRGNVTLAHPGRTGALERFEFIASNAELTQLATETLSACANAVLDAAGVAMRDVEWVLPHQPNGTMLARIVETFGIDPARVVPVVQEMGSAGATLIPISMDRLYRTRTVRPGDRILMVGVGAGMAYGAALHRVAPA